MEFLQIQELNDSLNLQMAYHNYMFGKTQIFFFFCVSVWWGGRGWGQSYVLLTFKQASTAHSIYIKENYIITIYACIINMHYPSIYQAL